MCLAPRVHIVHQGTYALGIRIIGDRVIGTEDKVIWSILQNLVNLSLCLFQGSRIELSLTGQTSKDRTIEQFGYLLSGHFDGAKVRRFLHPHNPDFAAFYIPSIWY